jgi:hypothetical protein
MAGYPCSYCFFSVWFPERLAQTNMVLIRLCDRPKMEGMTMAQADSAEQTLRWALLIAVGALLLAPLDWPYGYYQRFGWA